MTLKYIVRLDSCTGNRLASFPCNSDEDVLEVVRDLLEGTLDVDRHIKISRVEGEGD